MAAWSWYNGVNNTPSTDEPRIDLPHLTLQTVIGISIAVAGNVLISLALNMQKLAHLRLAKERAHARIERELHVSGDAQCSRSLHQWFSDDPPACSHECSRQPLIPSSSTSHQRAFYGSNTPVEIGHNDLRSRNNTTLTPGQQHGMPSKKPNFASRFLPFRLSLYGHFKDECESLSDTQETSAVTRTAPSAECLVTLNDHDSRKYASSKVLALEEDGTESDYLRSKLWSILFWSLLLAFKLCFRWSGFILMNVGETGNFISYAFAPVSVVAPLGTFALIANCFFAPLMLKERFRMYDLFGIILATIGAITVVLSTPSSDDDNSLPLTPDALIAAMSQRSFMIFAMVYFAGAVILAGLSEGNFGRRIVVVDVGLCAIFGGFTVLATKAISTLLTKEWANLFAEWIAYPVLVILIITGILQIRYLNRALKRFDSKIVIPTQFVLFTLSAVIGSAVLYKDFQRATFHQMVTFTYGCGATFAGVFVIAWANGNEHVADEGSMHAGGEGGQIGPSVGARDIHVHSLEARSRPALTLPSAARETPVLRNKPSTLSLAGYSPARNLLLVHTPPRDRSHNWDRDMESGGIGKMAV